MANRSKYEQVIQEQCWSNWCNFGNEWLPSLLYTLWNIYKNWIQIQFWCTIIFLQLHKYKSKDKGLGKANADRCRRCWEEKKCRRVDRIVRLLCIWLLWTLYSVNNKLINAKIVPVWTILSPNCSCICWCHCISFLRPYWVMRWAERSDKIIRTSSIKLWAKTFR